MRHHTLQAEPILRDLDVMEAQLRVIRQTIIEKQSMPEMAVAKLSTAREALAASIRELRND